VLDNPILPAYGVYLGSQLANVPETMRQTPYEYSAAGKEQQIVDGLEDYLKDITPDRQMPTIGTRKATPPKSTTGLLDAIFNGHKYSNVGTLKNASHPTVTYNPNSDRALFAHELGHVASQTTPQGKLAAQLRANPKLAGALKASSFLGPSAIAAATPGDDDLAASILAAYATDAPILVDEFEASRHALNILNKGGLPATHGQKGRLAGALLTYLTAPLVKGVTGNFAGNLVDQPV